MDSKAEKEACPGGKILRLDGHPELIAAAAKWFHEKWGIPERTYLESMEASAASPSGVRSGMFSGKTDGYAAGSA